MLKQLNSLTLIETLSCLVKTEVQEILGSIPGSGKDFYVCCFGLLLLCFYFFVQKTFIGHEILQFLIKCLFI